MRVLDNTTKLRFNPYNLFNLKKWTQEESDLHLLGVSNNLYFLDFLLIIKLLFDFT